MDRTTAEGSSGGLYVDRDLDLGRPGTKLVAKDRNAIQEEILGVIQGFGLTPDDLNNGQMFEAVSSALGVVTLDYVSRITEAKAISKMNTLSLPSRNYDTASVAGQDTSSVVYLPLLKRWVYGHRIAGNAGVARIRYNDDDFIGALIDASGVTTNADSELIFIKKILPLSDKLIAYIKDGAQRIYTSTDGASWTSRTVPFQFRVPPVDGGDDSIAYKPDGSIVVMVGQDTVTSAGKIIYSTNGGDSWTNCTLPSLVYSESITSVIYDTTRDVFYAISRGDLLKSSDGITWTTTLVSSITNAPSGRGSAIYRFAYNSRLDRYVIKEESVAVVACLWYADGADLETEWTDTGVTKKEIAGAGFGTTNAFSKAFASIDPSGGFVLGIVSNIGRTTNGKLLFSLDGIKWYKVGVAGAGFNAATPETAKYVFYEKALGQLIWTGLDGTSGNFMTCISPGAPD